MLRRTFALFALASLAVPVHAETEDGLYGAAIPANAVFVRTIGVAAGDHDIFGRVLPASALPEGTFVAFAPEALPEARPGAHYTIVVPAGGAPVMIEEAARRDPAKVYLSLLNVDAGTATLAVAGGGPQVIASTDAGTSGSRGVNPVAVTLEARVDGTSTELDVALRRKEHLTIVARAGGEVVVLKDLYGPVFEAASE